MVRPRRLSCAACWPEGGRQAGWGSRGPAGSRPSRPLGTLLPMKLGSMRVSPETLHVTQ